VVDLVVEGVESPFAVAEGEDPITADALLLSKGTHSPRKLIDVALHADGADPERDRLADMGAGSALVVAQ
jgi:hypothetical protein